MNSKAIRSCIRMFAIIAMFLALLPVTVMPVQASNYTVTCNIANVHLTWDSEKSTGTFTVDQGYSLPDEIVVNDGTALTKNTDPSNPVDHSYNYDKVNAKIDIYGAISNVTITAASTVTGIQIDIFTGMEYDSEPVLNGAVVDFRATVSGKYSPDQTCTWKIKASSGTISKNTYITFGENEATLHVGKDQQPAHIEVTATSTADPSKSASFTVKAYIGVKLPAAVTGLVYNETEQIGVPAGTGYTITGNTATAAGNYVATLHLSEGYCWSSHSTNDEQVSWSISKKSDKLVGSTSEGADSVGTFTKQSAPSNGVSGEIGASLSKMTSISITGSLSSGKNYNPTVQLDKATKLPEVTIDGVPAAKTGIGSTIITFYKSYLDTLEPGTYTVHVDFGESEYGEFTFEVTAPEADEYVVPDTGVKTASTGYWGMVFLISLGAAALCILRKRQAN